VATEVSLEATNDVAAVTAGEFEGTVMSPRHHGLYCGVLSGSVVVVVF
jgi:tetrahydromethanopterin S-methyltransferase subunit F